MRKSTYAGKDVATDIANGILSGHGCTNREVQKAQVGLVGKRWAEASDGLRRAVLGKLRSHNREVVEWWLELIQR